MLPKFCLFVILTVSFAHASFAAIAVGIAPENPDHPGKCWVEQYKKAIDVGAEWQPQGECQTLRCSKNAAKYVVNYVGCGVIGKSDQYEIVQDLTLPHPECCPTIKPHKLD